MGSRKRGHHKTQPTQAIQSEWVTCLRTNMNLRKLYPEDQIPRLKEMRHLQRRNLASRSPSWTNSLKNTSVSGGRTGRMRMKEKQLRRKEIRAEQNRVLAQQKSMRRRRRRS